jgi:hypothetical protein
VADDVALGRHDMPRDAQRRDGHARGR